MRFVYLHGFASGPRSSKAVALQSALARAGIPLEVPALDEGDFAHLTISGQLALIERTLHGEQVCLIGSSMGGYLAGLYAAGHPEVSGLVLLAPAFAFAARWDARINEPKPVDIEVFHYGDRAMRRVHYGLIQDALRYPALPDFSQPALIYHGIRDEVVPVENSRAFAATHANASLTELDSDHELLDVQQEIVASALPFIVNLSHA
jgi:uncharacterized protein